LRFAALGANPSEHYVVAIDMKPVLQPDRLIDPFRKIHIHVQKGAANLALEVMVAAGASVIPFKLLRQQNLSRVPLVRQLAQIAVDRDLADRRMLLVHFQINFLDSRMRVKSLQCFQYNLALYGVPFHKQALALIEMGFQLDLQTNFVPISLLKHKS
jgi:hypothetical protein